MSRLSSYDRTTLLPRQQAAPTEVSRSAVQPWHRTPNGLVEEGLAGQDRALSALAWLLPSLLTAVLGLVRTTWPGQNGAELNLWGFVRRPWAEVWQLHGQLDGVMIPYAVALKAWAEVVGTGDFALRLPALLAMAAATAFLAKLGTHLLNARAGFVAGLIFAVLPTVSRYAQEIGPYALAVCLATAATALLVRAFDRSALLSLMTYALVVGLLGLTSLPALSLLVGHGLAVLAMRPRLVTGWLAAVLVGLAPVGALAWFFRQSQISPSLRSPVAWSELVRLLPDLFGAAVLGGMLVGLGLLSLSLRKPSVIFTTWALTPVVVLYGSSFLTSFWRPEALLFTVPAWALLGAAALVRAPVVRGVLAALLAGAVGLPTQIDIRQRDGHGLGGPEVAGVLTENVRAGDVIMFGSGDEGRIGRDIIDRYLPATRRPKDILAIRAPRTGGELLAGECPVVAKCLGAAPRVWLLRVGATPVALDGLPAAKDGELRTRYAATRRWTAPGLTLTLFALKPGTTGPATAR